MIETERNNPYFALVAGEVVRLSNMEKFAPQMLPALDIFFREEILYAQKFMFENDALLYFIRHERT